MNFPPFAWSGWLPPHYRIFYLIWLFRWKYSINLHTQPPIQAKHTHIHTLLHARTGLQMKMDPKLPENKINAMKQQLYKGIPIACSRPSTTYTCLLFDNIVASDFSAFVDSNWRIVWHDELSQYKTTCLVYIVFHWQLSEFRDVWNLAWTFIIPIISYMIGKKWQLFNIGWNRNLYAAWRNVFISYGLSWSEFCWFFLCLRYSSLNPSRFSLFKTFTTTKCFTISQILIIYLIFYIFNINFDQLKSYISVCKCLGLLYISV